jgi:hypothetical protein
MILVKWKETVWNVDRIYLTQDMDLSQAVLNNFKTIHPCSAFKWLELTINSVKTQQFILLFSFIFK